MRSNPIDKGAPKKAYATSQVQRSDEYQPVCRTYCQPRQRVQAFRRGGDPDHGGGLPAEQLLEGKKVELGDLGFFYVRISGEGAPSAAEYNPAIYVKKLNVKWQCGARFKDLLGEAVFNLVAPRSVSQKVLKAHKAGETTVDISPEVTEEETDDQGGMGV